MRCGRLAALCLDAWVHWYAVENGPASPEADVKGTGDSAAHHRRRRRRDPRARRRRRHARRHSRAHPDFQKPTFPLFPGRQGAVAARGRGARGADGARRPAAISGRLDVVGGVAALAGCGRRPIPPAGPALPARGADVRNRPQHTWRPGGHRRADAQVARRDRGRSAAHAGAGQGGGPTRRGPARCRAACRAPGRRRRHAGHRRPRLSRSGARRRDRVAARPDLTQQTVNVTGWQMWPPRQPPAFAEKKWSSRPRSSPRRPSTWPPTAASTKSSLVRSMSMTRPVSGRTSSTASPGCSTGPRRPGFPCPPTIFATPHDVIAVNKSYAADSTLLRAIQSSMRLMVSGSDSPTKTRWSDRGISTYVPCRYLVAVVRGTRGSTVLSDSAPMASTGVVTAAKSTDAALARSSHGNAISQYTRPESHTRSA